MATRVIRILGIRGVPAAHGGFETFAERLAVYLVRKGWHVIVYCQEEGDGDVVIDHWEGVERVHIPVRGRGSLSTIVFDWRATCHASSSKDLCLTLGYNTAVFCALLRARGVPNVINMDGIEWSRAKWGPIPKTWFWVNDWAGCWLGNHLVADHPEICRHLESRVWGGKISTIAYGADPLGEEPLEPLKMFGISPGKYLTLIARPEPENSILEVVEGFSRGRRGFDLVVLGNYSDKNSYHKAVKAVASSEVKFVGAIYDKSILNALRRHCALYVHGHQVGGTNPSLVEALGAGNAVIAHDNRFTRWVAGEGARYFHGADEFSCVLESLIHDEDVLSSMRQASRERFELEFTWPKILDQYEEMLTKFLPVSG